MRFLGTLLAPFKEKLPRFNVVLRLLLLMLDVVLDFSVYL